MSSFGRFGNDEDHAMREFSICIKPLDGKVHARKRVLTVKSWSTVKDLKDVLQSLLHLPAASQRLFFRGGELRNPHTLQDCGVYRDGQTVYLASSPQDEMGKPYCLEPFLGAGGLPRSLSRVLGQARRGLDRGFKPELTLEGTGGTYFLQDAARQKVAVFKPKDEEPFAPNNPRDAMQGGLGGGTVSMRPGIDAGESYVREVAAYILDDRRLHGVPPTTLVEAKHPAFCYWDHKERKKLGSFQEFVRHDMVVEDISPSRLTPREVQKIALLDMRILNRDRNSVNILVRSRPRRSCSFSDRAGGPGGSGAGRPRHSRHHGSSDSSIDVSLSGGCPSSTAAGREAPPPRGAPLTGGRANGTGCESGGLSDSGRGGGGGLSDSSGRSAGRRSGGLLGGSTEYELIPIDHGLCLSNELVIDWCDWCWLDWPQIKERIDPELKTYIKSFNPEATAEKLGNKLNLPEPCLRNLSIAEALIKEGVEAGLTLYDIACIIRREDFDQISELETLVARATELARAAVDHQTSVAPSKRNVDLTSKSLDTSKTAAPAHPSAAPVNRSSPSVAWASEDKEKQDWFLSAEAREEALAGRASLPPSDQQQPVPPPMPVLAAESSTDASIEDSLSTAPALRVSGDSTDSGGGGSRRSDEMARAGGGGLSGSESESLRIWAPGKGSHSRESSAGEMTFMAGGDAESSASPPRSAESDTGLLSPKGFWREDFETIDARNATRRFSGWEDVAPGEQAFRGGERENSASAGAPTGTAAREGSGGGSCRADRADGGRPPLRKDGGNPAPLEDEADCPPGAAAGAGTVVKIGRKLFPSPEKKPPPPPPPPPPRRNTPPLSSNAYSALASAVPENGLEPMAEADVESPSFTGPPGRAPRPSSFWASGMEPTRQAAAGTGGMVIIEGKEAAAGAGAGLGWRRGEAGLVVPEPTLQQKPRPPVIQSVIPQRASRIGGDAQQSGGGSGDGKRLLSGPRPATTSPTLPPVGEHKPKAAKELQQALSPGVKITRSYSYHGLGSTALYDSAKRGTARFSLKKRPSENSEQFKACFFRFLHLLLRNLVKRRHRSIVKERGARAARQAAERFSIGDPDTAAKNASSAAAAAPPARGRVGNGNFEADERLRRKQPPPPAPPSRGGTGGPMPAAVRG